MDSYFGHSPINNKKTIKNGFHNTVVSLLISNNMIEVYSSDVIFLYTVNGIHKGSISIPNGS